MHLPRLKPPVRLAVTLTLLGVLGTTGLAQDPPAAPQPQTPAAPTPAPQTKSSFNFNDYTKPRSHFPNPIGPYVPHDVPEPNVSNTAAHRPLMQDGKLMLSLDDAIALALENNLDIAIARYNLPIADTDIMLANAGQATRGVNTGVVQGTPGGGVGGIGGTTPLDRRAAAPVEQPQAQAAPAPAAPAW